MEHEVQENSDYVIVGFKGDIDLQTSPDVRHVLIESANKEKPMLIDLAKVGYIDSSGVASLVECLQTVRKKGHKLVLVSISENAMRVFQLARLDKVFSICETFDDGVKLILSE